jgi:NADH:ubiquinone oxidoreductase subunit F (NADH-binding)
MGLVQRVLDPNPVPTLDDYASAGGGEALEAARLSEPVAVIEVVEASGLRGRGGAGFPTGTKWRTVAGMGGAEPVTVVVNAAEGEPGTLKDRTLIRRNPYRILEGALIAAHAVAADRIIIGTKPSSELERRRLTAAIAELEEAGWTQGISIEVATGSDRYLLGEETALLESLDGRPPFPRIAPPFRHGVEEVGPDVTSSAGTALADEEGSTTAPATLVNNVETLANIPFVVLEGPEAFRSLGTPESPGTMVCTVSGRVERAGIGEFELGTPLGEVIETLGGKPLGTQIVGVLSGTANPILRARALDAPLSWEGLAAAGGGLGSAGFIVLDDDVDIVSVAHGVSRFLSVESCGQCTPCKSDGLAMTAILDRVRTSTVEASDLELLPGLAAHVADGARCFLATQQQLVVESLLAGFPEAIALHADRHALAAEPFPIVPLLEIIDDQAVLDLDQLDTPPDWGTGTGAAPAASVDVRRDT